LRLHWHIGVLCLLWACVASAADLLPVREGDRIGAHVTGLRLPEGLRKDLRSGLTTRMLLRIELLADARVVETRMVELAVKYDLWDENFLLTITPGGTPPRVLNADSEVLALLSDVSLPRLFELSRFVAGREHVLKCDVLLNPIEEERLALIRKWVAENSVPSMNQGVDAARGGPGPAAGTAYGDLFNRIFERYASGDGGVAAWTDSLRSRPFRPEAVPNESR
jgi:hypothetical protein